ncbi:MAG: SPOR domain-containing protein [Acidobacteriota bacterium]|nr:SPOR domain-containing protein [Acidobacteriota bacterium]
MLEGEISQINLVERLVELWREQFTGAIRFENEGIIKILYFKNGDILSASTNDRSDSIDEILMRAGKVSREHVKQALAKRKESETLGDALLNLGFITRKELTWARRVQVVGVIRSIAAWAEGSFTIVADYLPKRDEGTLFSLPQVLIELIVTEQDRGRFEQALEGGNVVFAKTADFDDVWRKLGLNEDAEAIANEIDGFKSANEVATASGRETFNVYKLLDGLATLGVLTRIRKVQAEPELSFDDFATAGVSDAADLWNDPAPEHDILATPQFELDETEAFAQPTLEINMPSDGPGPEIEPVPYQMADEAPLPLPVPETFGDDTHDMPARSHTHETAIDREPTVVAPAPMPSWDAPPRDALSIPIQANVEPPADATEEQWGFDEAQIETARRAAVPVTASAPVFDTAEPAATPRREPVRRKRGGRGLLVALLLIAVLGAAGYFGFLWWQGQQQSSEDLLVQRPVRTRPVTPAAAAPPATIAEAPVPPATATTATSTAATATTSTAPTVITPAAVTTPIAAPAPIRVTAAAPRPTPPTPATTTAAVAATTALPRVTARTPAGEDRYASMARDFAADPNGKYTVQVQILCQTANLEKALRAGGGKVWFTPQTLGSRSCYRVFYGRFDTRAEAQQAMAQVPAALRDPNAAVKSIPR